MLKTSVLAALLAVTALVPAYGQGKMGCDDAHMKMMDDDVSKMTDADKKKAVMKHMDLAKAAMKKSDAKECEKHMDEAMAAMK